MACLGQLSAQDTLGYKWLIGGSFGISSSNSENETANNGGIIFSSYGIRFNPYLLKRLRDKWYIGGTATSYFGSEIRESASAVGNANKQVFNTSSIGIGARLRYIVNPNNKFRFMLEQNLSYGWSKNKNYSMTSNKNISTSNRIEANLNIRCSYPLNRRLLLVVSAGSLEYVYRWGKSKGASENKFNSNYIDFAFNAQTLGFGIEFLFGDDAEGQ